MSFFLFLFLLLFYLLLFFHHTVAFYPVTFFPVTFFPGQNCYFFCCFFISIQIVTFILLLFSFYFFPTQNCCFFSCYLFSCYFLSEHHVLVPGSAENKQEVAEFHSQHLPMHFRGIIWKIKSKSNFPVSFNMISAEMNLVGNHRTLRGLRTVNPEVAVS